MPIKEYYHTQTFTQTNKYINIHTHGKPLGAMCSAASTNSQLLSLNKQTNKKNGFNTPLRTNNRIHTTIYWWKINQIFNYTSPARGELCDGIPNFYKLKSAKRFIYNYHTHRETHHATTTTDKQQQKVPVFSVKALGNQTDLHQKKKEKKTKTRQKTEREKKENQVRLWQQT